MRRVDLKYNVQQRKLAASNKVFLDQLTLGERVHNKTATRLPVKLALAVLRDSRGEQVLLNILTKAVTEPFALRGSLFG
ncbi:MAG: DUF748 domain-containing protein, partial [Polyangia bacterium]